MLPYSRQKSLGFGLGPVLHVAVHQVIIGEGQPASKIRFLAFAFLAHRQTNNSNLIVIGYYFKSLVCIYTNECPIPEPDVNLVLNQSLNTDRRGTWHVY